MSVEELTFIQMITSGFLFEKSCSSEADRKAPSGLMNQAASVFFPHHTKSIDQNLEHI